MKKYINKTTEKLIAKKITVKALFIVCFTVCSFSGLAHTQTNKLTREQHKQKLIAEMEEKLTSFFSAINEKRELVAQQKNELQIMLKNFQTTRKNKQPQPIEEFLQRKIASLETADKEYQRMENEAIAMQTTLETQIVANDNINLQSIDKYEN